MERTCILCDVDDEVLEGAFLLMSVQSRVGGKVTREFATDMAQARGPQWPL